MRDRLLLQVELRRNVLLPQQIGRGAPISVPDGLLAHGPSKHHWRSSVVLRDLGFPILLARLEQLDRLPGHHRRDRVLVHELRMRVTP